MGRRTISLMINNFVLLSPCGRAAPRARSSLNVCLYFLVLTVMFLSGYTFICDFYVYCLIS